MTVDIQYPDEEPLIDKNWWKMWRNRRYHVSIMCFFGMFNMYACRICLSVAVVAMTKNMTSTDNSIKEKTDFDWDSSQKSIILSSFYYGYVPGQIIAGILLKYVSPHIVFGIGAAVPGLLTLITPVIASYLPFWVFVVTRCVMGLFQAVAIPCLLKFWTIWGPPLEIARLQGIAASGAFVGTVIILPLSGILADNVGWKYIFYINGSICLIWYILWLVCIRESPENDSFISNYEKNYIVTTIGKPKETVSSSIPWLLILSSLPVYGVLLAAFGWGWGYVTVITQLPMFLSDLTDFDLSKSGFLSALPYLIMSIMSILAGYIADYLLVNQILTKNQIRKYFISFTLLMQAVFIVISAFLVNPILNIIFISLGIGVGAFTFSGICVNYIDLAPALAALVAGLGNTMSTIPGIVSPLLTGVIVQTDKSEYDQLASEWRIVFFISAGAYVVGSVGFWLFGSVEMQPWGKYKQKSEVQETLVLNKACEKM